VIPGVGGLELYGLSAPRRAVTRVTGVTKRVMCASDEAMHFFSVDRDGALKICADDSDSSSFPYMSAEEKIFIGSQNLTESTNQFGGDYYAYTIRGNDIVKLGLIEHIPFKEKQLILVSKNRILFAQTNHLFLVVY
jgi:hypothetical protein